MRSRRRVQNRSSGLPELGGSIIAKDRIDRYHRHGEQGGLGHEHAIKGVAISPKQRIHCHPPPGHRRLGFGNFAPPVDARMVRVACAVHLNDIITQ